MIGIRENRSIALHDIIMPQNIMISHGEVLIFDKINMDEGRLYKFDKECSSSHLIIEVDNGDCFFGKDGYIYILYSDSSSSIEVYDGDGRKIKDVLLPETVYTIDVDSAGNIYAVCTCEEDMSIIMYNGDGVFLRTIRSRDMPLLSAVYSDGEYIYAGGFSTDIPARIEKLNLLSYIYQTYEIKSKGLNMLVSKILKHGQTVFAALTGENSDAVVLVNEDDGCIRQMDLNLGTGWVCDIFIKDNEFYVLCSDKKLLVYDIQDEEANPNMDVKPTKIKVKTRERYKYLSYLIWVKNFPGDFLNIFMKIAAPISMIFLMYANTAFQNDGDVFLGSGVVKIFLALSISFCIFATALKNTVIMWRRRTRVDNLLDIYNKIDTIKGFSLKSSIFVGVVSCAGVFSVLRSPLSTMVQSVIILLCGAGISMAVFMLCMKYIKKFKDDMENMVFELLSLAVKDSEIFKKITRDVKEIKSLGQEIYRIKVVTEAEVNKRAVRMINKWAALRKRITGDIGKLNKVSQSLVFDLNLKNRDIRYSRLSVIEDFICYIKKYINISSIMIETDDYDKNIQ